MYYQIFRISSVVFLLCDVELYLGGKKYALIYVVQVTVMKIISCHVVQLK